MSVLKKANEYFKAGDYREAYALYKDASTRYGENVVKYHLLMCERSLGKEINLTGTDTFSDTNCRVTRTLRDSANEQKCTNSEIDECLNNDTFLHEKILESTVKKPLSDITFEITPENNLSQKYKTIYSMSEQISKKKSVEEFDFLLEYANELRKIEMSDTYLKLIKYLLVQFDRLSEKNQKNMLLHLSNAIKLSRDEELINLILKQRIDLLPELVLSPKTKDVILGTTLSSLHDYQNNNFKFFNFDLHNEPQKAISLLFANNVDLKALSSEMYCLFCNLYAESQESHKSERYRIFLNKYLSEKKLPLVTSISLDSRNILSDIRFENLNTVNEGPLVSIIMSAYNAEETIDYAILSLLRQSYKNIEILVCDDLSVDGTFEKLKNLAKLDQRIKIYQSIENQGTYNIRNSLIKEAKGTYVTFHDSDDYALPNRIELQVESLIASGKVMCSSQWVRVAPSGSFVFFHDDKLSRFCVVSSMLKKEVFNSIPPFRTSLVAADTEFYEHMCCMFGEDQILKLDIPLILGLWGDGSLTKTPSLTAENNGYVAPRRRVYSDAAARQRVLGKDVVPDEHVHNTLVENNIYREFRGVKQFKSGGSK